MNVNVANIPAELLEIALSGAVIVTEFSVQSETWKVKDCSYRANLDDVTVRELVEIAFSGASLHVRHQGELRKLTREQVLIAANRDFSVRERLDRERVTPVILSNAKKEQMINDMVEAGLDIETATAIVTKQLAKNAS